jgi:hypothetical protein
VWFQCPVERNSTIHPHMMTWLTLSSATTKLPCEENTIVSPEGPYLPYQGTFVLTDFCEGVLDCKI